MKLRAVRDEHKQERRQAILDEAWALYGAGSYEAVTMAAVAERLGLAKGTLYLYFATKEELFLALLGRELDIWFDQVDAGLDRLRVPSPARVARLIALSLRDRLLFTRLLAVLSTLLEHNVSPEAARAFKTRLAERTLATGAKLEAALPFLRRGGGAQLLMRAHALVVGVRHLADPAPVTAKLLREPGLGLFRVDFETEIRETLAWLLLGAQSRQG